MAAGRPRAPRHGLARVLSKRGVCSRSEAERWIIQGRVAVQGRIVLDPEHPVSTDSRSIVVDGQPLRASEPVYLALNKPRGLVTSTADEQGRPTVYRCLEATGLPWVAPVGRLDKASEGLLLFSNDPAWAARITDPATGPSKTYHVQIDTLPDAQMLAALVRGVEVAGEGVLRARSVTPLRQGEKNAWIEVVLDEGRNRQIRRLLAAFEVGVLRLLRVAIGPVTLGDLPKGGWRRLAPDEVGMLAETGRGRPPAG